MNLPGEEPNQESACRMKRSAKEEETVVLGEAVDPADSSLPSCGSLLKKRKLDETLDMTKDVVKQAQSIKREITFNDDKNITHTRSDPFQDFPEDYRESDIWYSVCLFQSSLRY